MTSSTKAVNASRSNMATNDSAPMKKRMEHRYMLHLGKQCYLFDSNFRDTIYIHIRELAFRDNQPLPTAKGIALTLLKCNELYTYLPLLDIEVAQLKRNETFRRKLVRDGTIGIQLRGHPKILASRKCQGDLRNQKRNIADI